MVTIGHSPALHKLSSLYVFGSQALSFNPESLRQLRVYLIASSQLAWAQSVIAELASSWPVIIKSFPKLACVPGQDLLCSLKVWLRDGSTEHIQFPLPNTILTPLHVLCELNQFWRYISVQPDKSSDNWFPAKTTSLQTVGFCTGLLAAFAVSSSTRRSEFETNGAKALHLALLIGSLVDNEIQVPQVPTRSFSISWSSPEVQTQVEIITSQLSNAYISVIYDKDRLTVTVPQTSSALFLRELERLSAHAQEIPLAGQFHCQKPSLYDIETISTFCESNRAFQLPDASKLVIPTRSNVNGRLIVSGKLHSIAADEILLKLCNWQVTISNAVDSQLLNANDNVAFCFGTDRFIPLSVARRWKQRLVYMTDVDKSNENTTSPAPIPTGDREYGEASIAVVGMSCKVAGADDLEEFWRILCAGESQHAEVPSDRFTFDSLWREDERSRHWYGNFVKDHDAFDHKFFKKGPREMASTDPQQRLLMQVAYQAIEQSGYFESRGSDTHIGVYVGCGTVDYENNVACHQANAYTATGNLRSFLAGKISHYFGWTGPSMTVDTACSASAVAIHQACRAILNGDCTAALAGGVAIMTSPQWFQNLAGASFLSPTGACKPFDAKADGYCRGEGIGAVFLKKLSSALKDGDRILAVIAGTDVYQNENCTPITVPNAKSLSGLFDSVLRRANLHFSQISVVEAHGTGTPVGDPAEWAGIRKALGGPSRDSILSVGSVKGLVGHTEYASGIIALIKTILMIQESKIPPQASFSVLNPTIEASITDRMEVPTKLIPWTAAFRAALINNYGASGSNASMIVTQPPSRGGNVLQTHIGHVTTRQPFWLCGLNDSSLMSYAARLLAFVQARRAASSEPSIQELAANIARQSNRTLPRASVFACATVPQLEEKLISLSTNNQDIIAVNQTDAKPIILCFGGQISTYVGLDELVFESTKILKYNLDKCDAVCEGLKLDSIYPTIFERTPIDDTVKLQVSLFALQYAVAQSWIECGANIIATVGHSFGELTSLCITGVLSLRDSIKLVAGRARLVRDMWGKEKGSMLAIEGDLTDITKLVETANQTAWRNAPATIACFNGPRSFTLAGSAEAITAVENTIVQDIAYKSMRYKRLNVTNAFHCSLVDPLIDGLKTVGDELHFNKPTIELERATEVTDSAEFDATFVQKHMRQPVYFSQAVLRLCQKYPGAVWLEAGSNSTITAMASRVLSAVPASHFVSTNITSENSMQKLVDTTTSLWNHGISVCWWPHHRSQTNEYSLILLPPYQFEKSRHWLEWKRPQRVADLGSGPIAEVEDAPRRLYTFLGYVDQKKTSARFSIDVQAPKFEEYVGSHIIAQTAPLCPSPLYLDITIEALRELHPELDAAGFQPEPQHLDNLLPLSLNRNQKVFLELAKSDTTLHCWDWTWISNQSDSGSSDFETHASGRILFRWSKDPQLLSTFARYQRLIGYDRCLKLLDGNGADDVIQGRHIYKTFTEIVNYGEVFRGLQKVASKGDECAGRVVKAYSAESWFDTALSDCFCQVAGIAVNCMMDQSENDVSISNKIEQWIRSPKYFSEENSRPDTWDVYACHRRPSDRSFVSDVFVFDPRNGELVEVILGMGFHRIAKASLNRMLLRMAGKEARFGPALQDSISKTGTGDDVQKTSSVLTRKIKHTTRKGSQIDVVAIAKTLVSDLSGLETSEIHDDTVLADVGVDSLMGMELGREIESAFKCTLATAEFYDVRLFSELINCIKSAIGAMDDIESDDDGSRSSTELESETSTTATSIVDIELIEESGNPASKPFVSEGLALSPSLVLDAFNEAKKRTDDFISAHKMIGYYDHCLPRQTEMCVAHIIAAFDKLGSPIRTAKAGETLARIAYLPKHERLVECIYSILEKAARLIDVKGGQIVRTSTQIPVKSADVVLADLCQRFPDLANDHKLTHLAGSNLAACLTGETDGIKVLFGSQESRDLCSSFYANSPIHMIWLRQMEDILKRLISKLPPANDPLKIFEMGAGTGGSTAGLLRVLADTNYPVEYTFSDLSSSLVAGARKRFKHLPFMKFRVHDIEKEPVDELLNSQHIVIANNAVHATKSLKVSTKCIRDILRPDGFVMMVEMIDTPSWIDLIFGLLEGWWLFDDGRKHALAHQSVWEENMHSVGYGHVDWTDGKQPEASLQRIIIALASGSQEQRLPTPAVSRMAVGESDWETHQSAINGYVDKHTANFSLSEADLGVKFNDSTEHCVLITGATGSLGCHMAEDLIQNPAVKSVYCLNRRSLSEDAMQRQVKALQSRGILIDPGALAKLRVIESDTSKPHLGLTSTKYQELLHKVTHVIVNAWPMSLKRPLATFEPQMLSMRNLVNFAQDISQVRAKASPLKICFSFISSIATVGYHPIWTGQITVPENRMTARSIFPSGYAEAKLACEEILVQTLGRYPERFNAFSIRVGQIAGSKTSGVWNPAEHFSFIVKSAKTLKALPDFAGTLSWLPVNDVAATVNELLLRSTCNDTTTSIEPISVYHLENPSRQPWKKMIQLLATELDIPTDVGIVPFSEWLKRVRQFPGSETDNPAAKMADFLEDHFERMGCGGLVMDTAKSTSHSQILAASLPVDDTTLRLYIQAWKRSGFL